MSYPNSRQSLKILFVRSGNKGGHPISTNQGESLEKLGHIVIYYSIIGSGFVGYCKNILKLRKVIRSERPDLLHAHYYLSGIVSYLTFSNIPLICSLMGSDVNEANSLLKIIIKFFVKYLWTETIVKSVQMQNKLSSKHVKVLPNGINFELFRKVDKELARNELGWNINTRHILFPSNPSRKEKGFELAKAAFEMVKDNYADIKLIPLFNIPKDEVYLYYNAADLLLLTSSHEGSPNVIKEAMACNCPIVSTDVGDVAIIIANTEGCYLTSFNPADIANKINLALCFAKRTNGFQNIEHLSSEKIARKLINIYIGALRK